MRADRLVATLLFLQARGRVTAGEVAEELEVSIRTARRDLEALSIAGIPVYSQAGKGGGWSLVGGARTDLSGLTAAEARTLFLVAGPSSAVTPEAKAALRKLVQALPLTFRAEAEKAAAAVVLDPARWGDSAPPPPPHLAALQEAVVKEVQVRLGYTDRNRTVTDRTVHPLGLVAKGSVWYLVADTDAGLRTFRLWRIRSVEVTDTPARRPDGFDLAQTWRQVVSDMDAATGHGPGPRRRRAFDRRRPARPFRPAPDRCRGRRRRPRRGRHRLRRDPPRRHGAGRLQPRSRGARSARGSPPVGLHRGPFGRALRCRNQVEHRYACPWLNSSRPQRIARRPGSCREGTAIVPDTPIGPSAGRFGPCSRLIDQPAGPRRRP